MSLFATLVGPAHVAHANLLPLTDGRARIGERSWGDVIDPARRDARLLVRQALVLLLDALVPAPSDGLEPPSQLQVERALDRLDRAARVLPDDPELAFYRGVALATYVREEAGGRTDRRTDEAVRELERARALDAALAPSSVAYQLALLHTRAHRFDRAAEEYERARIATRVLPAPLVSPTTDQEGTLFELFFPPSLCGLATNQAEVEMLDGDLDEARAHYEESVVLCPPRSLYRALALFGRSLAEERHGSHVEALASAEAASAEWIPDPRDTVAQSLIAQHGPTAALHHPGVAFEPRWERHGYEALVHEALAARATDPDSAQTERARAQRSLRAFFTVGGNASPYAEVARQALARVEAGDIVVVGRVPAGTRDAARP